MQIRRMSTLAEDLAYLEANAFEFTLEINPDAASYPGAEELEFADQNDDWLTPADRDQAWATGRWVRAYLYPCGSVSFWRFAGVKVEAVVADAARVCREEIERWNKAMPDSPRPAAPAPVVPTPNARTS